MLSDWETSAQASTFFSPGLQIASMAAHRSISASYMCLVLCKSDLSLDRDMPLDLRAFTVTMPATGGVPPPLSSPAAAYDSFSGLLIIHGGSMDPSGHSSDTYIAYVRVRGSESWKTVHETGVARPARSQGRMVWERNGAQSQVYLFGGSGESSVVSNAVWVGKISKGGTGQNGMNPRHILFGQAQQYGMNQRSNVHGRTRHHQPYPQILVRAITELCA